MENKYKNAKIYKIVSNINDDVYYGSTTERTLARRLAQHVQEYKKYIKNNPKVHYTTSFKLIETNDYDIVLVEQVSCNSREELHRRERFYIENNTCVNKVIPGRTRKEYRIDNRKKIKEYNDGNKEKMKHYRLEHIEHKKDLERRHVQCECGANLTIYKLSRHKKSQIHQSYIKEQESKKFKINKNSFDFIFEMDSKMLLPKSYTNITITN